MQCHGELGAESREGEGFRPAVHGVQAPEALGEDQGEPVGAGPVGLGRLRPTP